MAAAFEIAVPRTESEFREFAEVVSHALQFPLERALLFPEVAGRENVRILRNGGAVVGGMAALPFGQFFGGRSVPMIGISAVGVAPQARSTGVATRMLRAELEAAHARGVALSALYPATQPVYRRLGYEAAGLQFEATLPVRLIDVRDRQLEIRPVTDGDTSAIEALYRAWAARNPGNLERSAFCWRRVREPGGEKALGFVLARGAAIEGYFFYRQTAGAPFPHLVRLTDFVVTTPAAGRRLLSFLADHRSVVGEAQWYCGPSDPLLALLAEQPQRFLSRTAWMLRLVDLAAALTARGWPRGMRAELHFDVRDDVLPGNAGRWVLRVDDGRAAVERGGRGSIAIDVRGLAALYSGYAAPDDLDLAGVLSGGVDELRESAALFAGPAPWMRDSF